MLKSVKGFTLMEILVVVTIIGILAAIAVPSYIYAVDKGRRDACAANVQTLATQVERHKLEKGKEVGFQEDIVAFCRLRGTHQYNRAMSLCADPGKGIWWDCLHL